MVSTNPQICSLIVSKDVWQKTFQVYLDRSEDAKPKSMRQVLVTLTDALNKWSAPDQAMIVKDSAIETLLSVILRNDSRIKVRPALQALEHFIRKGIVVIQDVVIAVQEFSTTQGKVPSGEIALQSMEAIPTAMDEGDDTVVSMAVLAASWEASIEAFVANLLEWLSYSDVAPAASHLISTFFRCLRAQSSKDVRYYHRVTKLPLWVSPFKQNVKENPDGLEVLKHHVLPGIFLLDSHDLLHFIHNLPFEHFLSGAFPEEDYPEVPLLFSSLQVAQGLGFVRVTSMSML